MTPQLSGLFILVLALSCFAVRDIEGGLAQIFIGVFGLGVPVLAFWALGWI